MPTDPDSFTVAASRGGRLGPYQIEGHLGAGGMGEVLRARDTRLGRTVAIKVLPPHLASREESRQRFEVEARAIATLNHPHICALYDIGQQDGVAYMVMEYLEGESLAQRLKRGPLPQVEALRHAVHIADALEQAHRRGIVHRDIKPGNIMLTKAGVKLLDFGLARLRETSPAAVGAGETLSMTLEGTVLGTPQYMGPEQIEGKQVDARADIFAFGSVLYEMLSGRRAFSGGNAGELMTAILRCDAPPPLERIPAALNWALKTCWAKDPDERWQSVGDLRRELQWIAEGEQETPVHVRPDRLRRREILAWSAAAVFGAAGSAAAIRAFRSSRGEAARIRFTVAPPPGLSFQLFSSPPAVAPDGHMLAFVAAAGKGMLIWVRALDSLEAHELTGTEGAEMVFWSPDSRSIGFFAQDKLKRIEVSGGPAQIICDSPVGNGGTWSEAGVIVFSRGRLTGPLYQVPAAGGSPSPLTSLEPRKQTGHAFPCFLPGGRQFLYTASAPQAENQGLFAASLGSSEVQRVLPALGNVRYAAPGYLLFPQNGKLMAQRFDAGKLRLEGDALPIADRLWSYAAAAFGVSDSGVLTYAAEEGLRSQLIWFDRLGRRLSAAGPEGPFIHMDLSRDGRRVLLERFQEGRGDLWVLDLARNVPSRLTSGPGWAYSSTLSPDGSRVAYTLAEASSGGLYQRDAAGADQPEELIRLKVQPVSVSDWSPDGRYIVYSMPDPQNQFDLWVLPISSGKAVEERKPFPYLQSPFAELQGRLSPDGRWMAYVSNEAGTVEVYVSSFPTPSTKVRISSGGGKQPRWRGDGKELFYLVPADRMLMAVPIQTTPTFQPGTPTPLFRTDAVGYFDFNRDDYGVTSNGERFLVNTRVGGAESTLLTVATNWQATLPR